MTSEDGVVGGIEVIPFALLVLVGGWLLIADAWSVIDGKFAAEAAARESGRTYVESDPDRRDALARQAALDALTGAARGRSALTVRHAGDPDRRCATVRTEVVLRVHTVPIPFVGKFGPTMTVRGRHRDVVDPFRSGLDGRAACDG